MSESQPVNRHVRRDTLPQAPTRLLGREQDVARVVELVSAAGVRLLTLTGPGGVGKTRLALEVAHRLSDAFAGDVHWLDLTPVRDAIPAITALATAVGAPERHDASPLDSLIETLRDRRSLLIIDNIEQVAGLDRPIAALVARCPRLTIISTGRSPLDIRAEHRYPVAPLATPASNEAADHQSPDSFPAVRLFIERVQAVRPDFVLNRENLDSIAEICRRVDGLPLAIELVATQTELFGPADLLTRLDRQLPLVVDAARDLPQRHQTLERTIVWSYDLLDAELQACFRRLSVFTSGFTLAAADAVLHDATDRDADAVTPRQVSALLRRSLLHRAPDLAGQERFRLLETTRGYALERLEAENETDNARFRHAMHFLRLAEQADANLSGPEGGYWLARLDADHANLGAALDWSLATGETHLAVQLARSLARFWYVRGHLSVGRSWLERVLERGESAATPDRVALLRGLSSIAGAQGDARAETAAARQALRLSRELGDERNIAQSLQSCGSAARSRGDPVAARRDYATALTILEQLGDEAGQAVVLNNLGLIVGDMGDINRARELFEQSLRICERLGSPRGMAIASCNLGNLLAETGGPQAAAPYLRNALMHFQALGDMAGAAWSMQAVAALAHAADESIPAARLHGAVEAIREHIGWSLSTGERAEYDESLAPLRRRLDPREMRDAWAAGRALATDAAIAESLSILERIASRPPDVTTPLGDRPAGLSERESEILRLIATGLTNAEIAHRLLRSPHTIDTHVRRIYRKLGVQSRGAATRMAAEHGLLSEIDQTRR